MAPLDRKTLMHTGLATTGTEGRVAARSWTCRVVSDHQEPQQVAIGARPAVVGAGRTCDLILTDPQVSRQHAELQVTADGVRIRDLGSTNGTFWQGSRIADIVVPSGSSVKFGNTLVNLSAANSAPSRSVAGEVATYG